MYPVPHPAGMAAARNLVTAVAAATITSRRRIRPPWPHLTCSSLTFSLTPPTAIPPPPRHRRPRAAVDLRSCPLPRHQRPRPRQPHTSFLSFTTTTIQPQTRRRRLRSDPTVRRRREPTAATVACRPGYRCPLTSTHAHHLCLTCSPCSLSKMASTPAAAAMILPDPKCTVCTAHQPSVSTGHTPCSLCCQPPPWLPQPAPPPIPVEHPTAHLSAATNLCTAAPLPPPPPPLPPTTYITAGARPEATHTIPTTPITRTRVLPVPSSCLSTRAAPAEAASS